jgi:hypothetical protein
VGEARAAIRSPQYHHHGARDRDRRRHRQDNHGDDRIASSLRREVRPNGRRQDEVDIEDGRNAVRRPSGKVTTTIEQGSRSFTERALGKSGLALLQFGVIILAAFLAAAFVQRVLIGDYALKIGPLDLGAAQESKEDTTMDLTAKLTSAVTKQAEELAALSTEVGGNATLAATMSVALRELNARLEGLEAKGSKGD